jgi:tetratricopeptide (TPR) repeat protein
MRRGSLRATLGNTQGAVEDLGAAREEWVRCGCPSDAARADTLLAEAHLKVGDTAATRELLDAADAVVPPGISENRLILLTVRGDLLGTEGDRPAAAAQYGRALDVAVTSRDLEREASLLRKLAALHHEQGQPQSAADWERRARVAGERLAEVDAYDATDERREAQDENGKGLRSLTDVEDRTTALYRAREFFAAAERLDPDNFWPLLNVSFAYGEQGDWQGATEALGRVLDLCPAPMRTGRLHRCLRDYVLEYAKGLVRRDDPGQAVEVLTRTLDRLSDELPRAETTSLRVVHAVALAMTGKSHAARAACHEALAADEDEGSWVRTVAELIHTVESYCRTWPTTKAHRRPCARGPRRSRQPWRPVWTSCSA